ncbi:hypothetical protein ACP3P6_05875, partial [Enterobacter mori]
NGEPAHRVVLGAWHAEGSMVKVTPEGVELIAFVLTFRRFAYFSATQPFSLPV